MAKAKRIYSEIKRADVKGAGGAIVTKYYVSGVATAFFQEADSGGGRWRYAVTVTWRESEDYGNDYGNDYGTHYDELMPMYNFTQAQAIRMCIAELDNCVADMSQRISKSALDRIGLDDEPAF